jgi:hypothetical protein
MRRKHRYSKINKERKSKHLGKLSKANKTYIRKLWREAVKLNKLLRKRNKRNV